jgi:flagellar basal-body rod protein FlgG
MFGTILSGMSTSMFEISVVSNNVANASTTAFRKSDASFSDLYRGASAETVSRTSTGAGSIIEQTQQNIKQGALVERDGVLNMALVGSGMFVTTTPNSDGTPSEVLNFTRDGEFALDESGVLRSSSNDIVYGFDGIGGTTPQKIVIPFANETDTKLTSIEVGSDGLIEANYGSQGSKVVGQLAVATFANASSLQQLGLGSFQASQASGSPILGIAGSEGFGSVQVGKLEASNVNLTTELTSLIRAQQQFSGSSKILQAYSDMIKKLTQ